MKKIILSVAILLLLFVIGFTPWITGYCFKQSYLDLIANYNAQNPNKIVVVNYQLGWFSSQVELKMNPIPTPPQAMMDTAQITLDQNITHGPFVQDKVQDKFTFATASIDTLVHLSDRVETFLFSKPKPDGVATIASVVAFNNEWRNRIKISPMTFSFMGIDKTQWQGLEGTVSFTSEAGLINHIHSHFVLGPLTATLDDPQQRVEVSLQSLTQDVDSTRQPIGLWTGHSEAKISAFSYKLNNELRYGGEKLHLAADSTLVSSMYNVTSELTIDKIEMPQFAVPVIAPVSYKLSVNNLNATELNHFITSIQEARNKKLFNDILTLYQTVLPRILTPSSTINLDVAMNTSLGNFLAKGIGGWPTGVALPNTLEEVKNAHGKVDIRIALPLANAIIDQIINIVTANAIRELPATPIENTNKPNDSAKTLLNNKLTALMQSGTLPLDAAIQIMSLYDSHATPEVFANSLRQLNLNPQVQEELASLYIQLANTPPAPSTPVMPTNVQPQTNQNQLQQELSTSMKNQVEQFIQLGYLIKDNNDYVVSITYENNAVKINGKDLPPEILGSSPPPPNQIGY